MKAYFLTSPYLSDIQKGIQVSHAMAEMATKAMRESTPVELIDQFTDWASNHKTMVVLTYGFDKSILSFLIKRLIESEVSGPDRFFAEFKERELNDLSTLGFIMNSADCRLMGEYRQARKFKVSKKLGEHAPFWNVEELGQMNKKKWMEALQEVGPDKDIEWEDFLRVVSTFHMA